MNTHKFVCPDCKHEWSEEFGYEAEVMCPACETVWRLKFDKFDTWPPTEYRIEGRSEEQPKFDLTINGIKIPGCMSIKVEQELYKAHSLIRYWMTARFFGELRESLVRLVSGPNAGVIITLRGHPEITPVILRVSVSGCHASDTLTFETDGAGYEFAYQQMKAMWEKSNR